jgi:hypothetical protein
MNAWTVWTWISIGILTIGSTAVFIWFVVDILRIRREILEEEELREPFEGET